MNIKMLFARKRPVTYEDENRPIKSVEIGPNMWQLVYADEPVSDTLKYNDYKG
ncbi:MAG: hypothetical protein M1360_04105 [Candidatus Marsarchaeota archaeon]|jgi:hypothetical protein|nr:hypothetical protein [Candidatus Marsarchaeota archaeon]MCL5419092.1 hypothetical protein [Candidatus Marsarchaeota archaeon]